MLTPERGVVWDVLRLDLLHPVVSGNKVFKLRGYVHEAKQRGMRGLVSYGGAWSNHLHALAFAAREAGLESIGIVRGESPAILNLMLADCQDWGMELRFMGREAYRHQQQLLKKEALKTDDFLIIPEGGYGITGAEGAAGIWEYIPLDTYTHIVCAVGTGTMIAGLALGKHHQPSLMNTSLVGISILKNEGLGDDIQYLLKEFSGIALPALIHRCHGGGYAKVSEEQIGFMRDFYLQTEIPTDIIYTGKLMHGIQVLLDEGHFEPGSRILALHSGGLQGNRSLKNGILPY